VKYLKKINLISESYVNPISDYITDFIDLYDFEIETPNIGVCDMILKSANYNPHQILDLYNELLIRLEDDDFEIKKGAHTYLSFYPEMVHIRIERIVKDESQEFKFETKEQGIAYNAILKVISPNKLKLDEIQSNGLMRFSKMDDKFKFSSLYRWISIKKYGEIFLPILRGRKSHFMTELPFNDSDVNWFKRLLELDKDGYRTKEYDWMSVASQEELRKKYPVS
jgi:hypothetical protein